MLVRFTKQPPAAAADGIACVRPDGSTTEAALARQGILPHEAFHFVVESTLGWREAFFGPIARGETLDAQTTRLHGTPGKSSKQTQGRQAEALIECLQAEQWGGAADPLRFAQDLLAASRRHGVAPPDLTPEELQAVRAALREFGAAWRPLQPGRSLERTF